MISKSYYQQLRSSERQALVGPPESMREHVVAASKAMRNGDWKKCRDFVINDKMNAKVWDLFYEADKVRAMLARKIQEETLRTYLFTYSKVYNSISIVSILLFFCAQSVFTNFNNRVLFSHFFTILSFDEFFFSRFTRISND